MSGRKIPANVSPKYRPIPAPIPASWLRASVAIAKPSAPSSMIATQPRANCSGSRPRVAASVRPLVDVPAIVAPTRAATTPIANVTTRPTAITTAIEAKESRV